MCDRFLRKKEERGLGALFSYADDDPVFFSPSLRVVGGEGDYFCS